MDELSFNPRSPTTMHIDLNSCFATIEQQANPHLRGRPIAIAAYDTPNGCILAPSVEAKRYGVKTGMRVCDGRSLCPGLIVMGSDPWKYRNVHLKLRSLLADYTDDFYPKSIDEFVLNLEGYPSLVAGSIRHVASEIKMRIKQEIGEWLAVSIGIAPNRLLAKLASGLHKPDGLDEITAANFRKVYDRLSLTDLPYIKVKNAARLGVVGIYSVVDFYQASLWKLKTAFQSINGYYWFMRLRGWEIDDVEFGRRSYGNSYSFPKPLKTMDEISPILMKLVTKTSHRLRCAGFSAGGVHVAAGYRNGQFWHKGAKSEQILYDTRDIYKKAYGLLLGSPHRGVSVRDMAVSCFNLKKSDLFQLNLFEDVDKKVNLIKSVDAVNERWGEFVVTPARMLAAKQNVPDRIAFGGVKELEEFTLT